MDPDSIHNYRPIILKITYLSKVIEKVAAGCIATVALFGMVHPITKAAIWL